ncbi:DNA primase [Orientia chuto str. Dubai]|uniref:DNA primase n=1 Tax=Orientia chuto str. Dubai TaxID=1359168 RepID=A0A0F3MJH1_9RICK|nr:DNA primase [Candidatus Orientia mediorientalis]KJV55801.1 DNA primase [Orientia chuto str. Dubai]
MRSSNFFYENIRTRLAVSTIVMRKVNLIKKGAEYIGICPFHSEKTPSFTVNDRKKFYHCFGCSAHGDVIKFIADTSGLSYRESALKLAQENGIDIPVFSKEQEKLYEEIDIIYNTLELAQNFFIGYLSNEIRSYLHDRGLSDYQIKKYKIGYAPGKNLLQNFLERRGIPLAFIAKAGLIAKNDNSKSYEIFRERIIFPIINAANKTIGFGGRVVNDDSSQPKYLNSPETAVFKKNEALYGEDIATSHIYSKNRVVVVEGYMDLIALQSQGIYETVATLGTALTEKHLHKLWQICDEIILCFDGDQAGNRAMQKAVIKVLPYINCSKIMSFIMLPDASDPDQFLKQHGIKHFQKLINERLAVSEALWILETKGKVFSTAESKAQLEKKINNHIKEIKDWILTKNYQVFFKQKCWQLNRVNTNNNNLDKQKLNLNIPTSKEYLEYVLLLLIAHCPALLNDDIIAENFVNLEFCNKEAYNARQWLINIISSNNSSHLPPSIGVDITELIQKFKKVDVVQLIQKLLEVLHHILFTIKSQHNIRLLWGLFYKKYQVILIKDEYINSLNTDCQNSINNASLYQQEILKIEHEIDFLNEALHLEQ